MSSRQPGDRNAIRGSSPTPARRTTDHGRPPGADRRTPPRHPGPGCLGLAPGAAAVDRPDPRHPQARPARGEHRRRRSRASPPPTWTRSRPRWPPSRCRAPAIPRRWSGSSTGWSRRPTRFPNGRRQAGGGAPCPEARRLKVVSLAKVCWPLWASSSRSSGSGECLSAGKPSLSRCLRRPFTCFVAAEQADVPRPERDLPAHPMALAAEHVSHRAGRRRRRLIPAPVVQDVQPGPGGRIGTGRHRDRIIGGPPVHRLRCATTPGRRPGPDPGRSRPR